MNILFRFFFIILVIILVVPVGYNILGDSHSAIQFDQNDKIKKNSKISVYIINLDEETKRLENISYYVNKLGLGFKRISAVVGKNLSFDEVNRIVDINSYKSYLGHSPSLGIIGSYLSHLEAWKEFLKSDEEYALIFEDDVKFNAKELMETTKELIEYEKLWDIVNFETYHGGSPLKIKKLSSDNLLVVYLTEVTHSSCYMINRKAAKLLLSKAMPIKMPLDHYYNLSWELNLKYTGIQNPKIVKQNDFISNIKNSPKIDSESISVFYKIKKLIYKVQSNIMRFVYNIKLYLLLKEIYP